MLTLKEQKKAAKAFAQKWAGVGDEKQDSQRFWIELLQTVYGIENPTDFIRFEQRVQLENVSYIDAIIPATHTMIEQKSLGKSLTAAIRQSDGSLLTPIEQANRYAAALPYSERPRWIISCNFSEFRVYDMEHPNTTPEIIYLQDLEKDAYRLNFMINVADSHVEKELEISKNAGELVGKLYDLLLAQYRTNPNLAEEFILHNANKLCVRLVFCLYAEDAGLLGSRSLFHDYIREFKPQHVRKALLDLFRILDTKISDRDPFEEESLLAFPYVNGNLFNEKIEIPPFNEEALSMLLNEACAFDWSAISPTIFGGIFESTLNPETRRHGGMHYTSIENIHKVIDPLFLDGFKEKFQEAMNIKTLDARKKRLKELQKELASLTFLDPAAGSGNFLTETYLSLRRLENDILRELVMDSSGSGMLGFIEDEFNPIEVSIQQFYGIEINDFAVAVARTAMWIAEAQMFAETEGIIHKEMEFLPLHSFTNIHEGNAIQLDWKEIIAPEKLSYIIGNPPFMGARVMSSSQKKDINDVFQGWKHIGNLDYVTCWYKKAADFMLNTSISATFVSTNSISQGEMVAILWKPLIQNGLCINYAYTSFIWNSESAGMAHVHCVIVNFSYKERKNKLLFNDTQVKQVANINGYLIDGENIYIESRTTPLCNTPPMSIGNQPIDDGNYLFTKEEMNEFIKIEPMAKQFFKVWYGAKEFINQSPCYCLWLGDCPPHILRKMPHALRRVENVKEFRLKSKRIGTQKLANRPTRFQVETMPTSDYLLIPCVSSERRKYIPIGLLSPSCLTSNAALILPNATLYHFAILTSNVHMAWMRAFAGRLEMRYRYSKDIVYNNFPWPTPTEAQQAKIETTAQGILDARALYPESSLADLYDDLTMPIELRNAHRQNNKAVMEAYGFPLSMTEEDCVAALMKLYEKLT